MILECPNCETRYEMPVALPPEGRKVRCARCQHIWTATAEPEPEPATFEDEEIIFKESAVGTAETEAEPEAGPEAGTAPEAFPDLPIDEALSIDAVEDAPVDEDAPVAGEVAHPEDEAAALHADESEETHGDTDAAGEATAPAGEDAPAGEEAPEDARAGDAAFPEDDEGGDETAEGADEEDEAEQPSPIVIGKAQRRAVALGPLAAGWGLLVLLVVGLAGFVTVQRVAVVRALPGTAWIYERAGLPVNVRGLAFENVDYTWDAEAGRAILEVRGDIVNVSGESRKVPTVVLGLRTAEEVEVYQWAQEVGSGPLAPEARTDFVARIPTPPNSIRGIQVRFAKVR